MPKEIAEVFFKLINKIWREGKFPKSEIGVSFVQYTKEKSKEL